MTDAGGPSEAAITLTAAEIRRLAGDVAGEAEYAADQADEYERMDGYAMTVSELRSKARTLKARANELFKGADSLGDARSVNEAWCRADQTRLIVEWLQDPTDIPFHLLANGDEFARRVARKFGGKDA